MKSIYKNIFAIGATTLISSVGIAQKLPSIQKSSVWAPASVKIDGRSTEWNGSYQAHNSATDAFYTIANDDQNLYLAIYLPNAKISFNKVMTGGITFIVKTNAGNVSLRYPAFPNDYGISLPRLDKDYTLNGSEDDSIIVNDNKIFAEKARELEIKGAKGVDSLISVFNEQGIKVAGHFDAKQGFLYELALPLKYLKMVESTSQTLSYRIILNGSPSRLKNTSLPVVTGGTRPDGTPIPASEIQNANAALLSNRFELFAPTSFSGQYALAQKR